MSTSDLLMGTIVAVETVRILSLAVYSSCKNITNMRVNKKIKFF